MMSVDRFAGLSHDGTSRLFIALPLPDAVRDQIDAVQRALRPCGWPVKWVDPDLAHITLKFLGDTRNDLITTIAGRLTDVARSGRPDLLSTGQCGAFPSLNRPQVLWIGVDGNVDTVTSLADGIDAAMAELGYDAETRPFRPHITLGRVRRGERLPGDAGQVIGQAPTERVPLQIDRFQLVQSVLGRSGPRYTSLAEWRIGAAASIEVELVEHG